jgi:hypothetical protein
MAMFKELIPKDAPKPYGKLVTTITYTNVNLYHGVRLLEPDLGELPDQDFDWCHSVYGKVEELVPNDTPKPLRKFVTTITYTDANLYHSMLTGRSVTGILHL